MTFPLPRTLTLPSGRVVGLDRSRAKTIPGPANANAPLFTEARAVLAGGLLTDEDGVTLDPASLVLRDFHVLRAVLMRSGLVREEAYASTCHQCDAPFTVVPCERLEIGAWAFGEPPDPELDATLPFGEPVDMPPLPLGKVRSARSVTFADRTVAEAAPAFAILARDPLVVDVALVTALGVTAVGGETSPARIARALREADDRAFAAVSAAFVDSHYPLRLVAIVKCGSCGARNEVDAPYERELAAGLDDAPRGGGGEAFPDLATFADRAQALAAPMIENEATRDVVVFVEGGVPAVDAAGHPLLGSYDPPTHPDDAGHVTRPPTVTVYHRTFAAQWDEEGPYDWQAELEETIEHELEHHVYFLRGGDPMGDDEDDALLDEEARLVGRHELQRRDLAGFGGSLVDFARRTWPIWLLSLVALIATLLTQR